jgi:hypothetical protein
MLNPKFTGKAAISALLLGVTFLAANLYLGATGHPKLANLFFVLAILSNTAFAVLAVLWVFCIAWLRESERPPTPTPGAAANKKPRPPQP